MSGETKTEGRPKQKKVRKRRRRRKNAARQINDVQREKIYMALFLTVVGVALLGLVGLGIWVMVKNLLNSYG